MLMKRACSAQATGRSEKKDETKRARKKTERRRARKVAERRATLSLSLLFSVQGRGQGGRGDGEVLASRASLVGSLSQPRLVFYYYYYHIRRHVIEV